MTLLSSIMRDVGNHSGLVDIVRVIPYFFATNANSFFPYAG